MKTEAAKLPVNADYNKLALIVTVEPHSLEPDGRLLTDGARKRLTDAFLSLADGIRDSDILACYKATVDIHGTFIADEMYPEGGLNLDVPISPSDRKISELRMVQGLAWRFSATRGPVKKEERLKIRDPRYEAATPISPSDSEMDLTLITVLCELADLQQDRITRKQSLSAKKGWGLERVREAIRVRRENSKINLVQDVLSSAQAMQDSEDRYAQFRRLTILTTGEDID